jgi:hypothetical protein
MRRIDIDHGAELMIGRELSYPAAVPVEIRDAVMESLDGIVVQRICTLDEEHVAIDTSRVAVELERQFGVRLGEFLRSVDGCLIRIRAAGEENEPEGQDAFHCSLRFATQTTVRHLAMANRSRQE